MAQPTSKQPEGQDTSPNHYVYFQHKKMPGQKLKKLEVPVLLHTWHQKKSVEVQALVNSGVQSSFVNHTFVHKHNLLTFMLPPSQWAIP